MLRSKAAILLALVSLVSCGVEVNYSMSYANGQKVSQGDTDRLGRRQGAWLYFDPSGSVVFSATIEGREYKRTGFYADGLWVRELTDAEILKQRRASWSD
ncbi:MAG: hypothetical protein AAF368_07475 [Planctomycetota bacterium]